MTRGDWGIRLLMVTLGLWVLLRSVNKDSSGRTLIDHILGNPATTNSGTQPFGAATAGISGSQGLAGQAFRAITGIASAPADNSRSAAAISSAIQGTAAAIKAGTKTAKAATS